METIHKTFKDYGFAFKQDWSYESCYVYIDTEDVFQKAYILIWEKANTLLSTKEENAKCKKNLEDLGFSVLTFKANNSHAVRMRLFSDRFNKENAIKRALQNYKNHTEKAMHSLSEKSSTPYKYINIPFMLEGKKKSNGIVRDVLSELENPTPKLIIIEAAAGFGKTSTAYEISKAISEKSAGPVVILSELSRDRKASTFRHILLEEIDKSFPRLSSELVQNEILLGNILLILDGFDELLRGSSGEREQYEQSEAMLATIAKLLRDNAKIILTTRKTAILESEGFLEWTSSNLEKFTVKRFSLLEPDVHDWLTQKKIDLIRNKGVRLDEVSNPAMLAYLSYLDETDFHEIFQSADEVHETYFTRMLTREKKRQDLLMEEDEQKALLTRLAGDMISRNYTKDSREEIIEYFLEKELALIELVRSRYSPESRPKTRELAIKLTNHAYLDRAQEDDKIGFLNNFALGYYLGRAIIENPDQDQAIEEIFIDYTVEAYRSRSEHTKKLLWANLRYSMQFISQDQQRLDIELRLNKNIEGKYVNSTVSDMFFCNITLFCSGSFENMTFCSCRFEQCTLALYKLKEAMFINCEFYGCNVIDDPTEKNTQSQRLLEEVACIFEGNNGLTQEYFKNKDNNKLKKEEQEDLTFDTKDFAMRYVLEKFWPKGREYITFAHRPLAIFYGKNDFNIRTEVVSTAIQELKKQDLIMDGHRKSWIGLNTSKLNEIIRILDR